MTIEQAIQQGIYKLTDPRLRSMDNERYIYILDCEFTKQMGAEDQSWCRVQEYALLGFPVRRFYLSDQELRSTEWEPWEEPPQTWTCQRCGSVIDTPRCPCDFEAPETP